MRPSALELRFKKRVDDLETALAKALVNGWADQAEFLESLLKLNKMIAGYVWPRTIH